ncbi:MAG TPA: AsmA-like C-terminal domain-containing protein [Burkholderiales bacterium]|nr:AsmA-like C-terminal domain-containing protein [Burkholderiales bacterium]
MPSIQTKLERQLSQALQGQIAWDALEIRLLPFPRGVVRNARITLPGTLAGRADLVELDLRLLPLLRGRVDIGTVTVSRPVFRVDISLTPAPAAKPKPAVDPITAYRQALQPVAKAIQTFAPHMTVVIDEGQVEFNAPGLPRIGVSEMKLRAETDGTAIVAKASAVGNYWEHVQIDARLVFADLSASATLEAIGVKPQTMLDTLLTDIQPTIVLPSAGLHVEAHTDGRSSLEAGVVADVPSTSLRREGRQLDIVGVHIKGAAKVGAQDIDVALTELRFGELLPAGRARLRLVGSQSQPQVDIEIAALDLNRLRAAALDLAGDRPLIRDYVARIRGGVIVDAQLSAKADTFASLFGLSNLTASLTLKDGAGRVPVVEQEVENVSAKVELLDGTVKVRDATAGLGGSRVSAGSVDYGIESGRVNGKADFDLDLTQALEITRNILPKEQRAALEAIESLRGRVHGVATAVLAGSQWSAEVAIVRSDSMARVRGVPWPLSLREGRVTALPKQIAFDRLAGSVGASTFAQARAKLDLESPLRLTEAGAHANLTLDEIYPWLQSQEQLAQTLQPIKAVGGNIEVTLNRLSGRLDRPQELAYDLTLQPRRIRLEVAELPGPTTIDGGAVHITPEAINLDGVGAALADATLRLSGKVGEYRSKSPSIDASIADGTISAKLIDWIWRRAGIEERLMPKTPMQLAAQRLQWRDGGANVVASVRFPDGQTAGIDLGLKGGAIDVRRFTLNDRESDMTMSFATRGRLIDVAFSGKLASRSVAAMLKNATGEHPGRIYGDMRITLDRDRQGRTSATGGLAGENLNLGTLLPVPLKLERVDLEGDGPRLRVHELAIDWAAQKAVIRGEIARTASGPVIHAEIDSPGIVIDALLPASGKPEDEVKPAPKETPDALKVWPLPITGTLAVRAGYLEFHGLRAQPVHATLAVEAQKVDLRVTDAALCGVDFPFTASVVPGELSVAARLSAKEQQLEGVAKCFTDQRLLITGQFDLAAQLTAKGKKADELIASLDGPLQFRAHDGEIRKFALLGNILALKNVSGMFKQEVNLGGEGFRYRQIIVRGRFGNRKFAAEEGSLDSDALGVAASGSIDLSAERETRLTVLVAPFSGLDRLVRKIPILGYVLGGVLTSIPVGVTGDIRDPLVVPLGPGAITSELVGVFERTLKLPGRMLQPPTGQPPAQ